ncbi:SH3 domain-containing protein [Viridibacillus sp. YIM B01967]|uniref:SH3 domain-containing protein n=1 Tax=Viridibacillus soli TaxID=2798301 RepID=A0ABS1H1W1_9BACL|nr:SH3 domain-containing protein [Viridibacillus soli]MBK3493404.1 SH3 domain-containing protein [Viridibacillus soli]
MNKKIVKLFSNFLLITILICSYFYQPVHTEAAASTSYKVTASQLTLREGPSTSTKKLTSIPKDKKLTKISTKGTWFKVKYSGKTGWVSSKYLSKVTTTVSKATKTATAKVDNLNIRSGAAATFKSLGKLTKGTKGTVLDEKNGWVRIKTDKYTGWVSKSYLTIKTTTSSNTTNTAATNDNVGKYFLVTIADLNVREKAFSTAGTAILGTVKKGSVFKILKQSGDWIHIEYKTSKKGWVSSKTAYGKISTKKPTTQTSNPNEEEDLEDLPTEEPEEPEEPTDTPEDNVTYSKPSKLEYINIQSGYLNIRSKPNTKGTILSQANAGNYYTVLQYATYPSNEWVYVEYAPGKKGWISNNTSNSYITLTDPATNPVATSKKTIILDAGHGGSDPGAGGGGYTEASLTYAFTLKTKSQLESMGYTVYTTRSQYSACSISPNKTIDLQCRVNLAKTKKADIFVSIHMNSASATAKGTETYYSLGNPYPTKSRQLANAVHNSYQPAMGSKNRLVKQYGFYVNRMATVPSILLEVGFISNIEDRSKLINSAHQTNVSRSIALGIHNYFKAQ